MIYSGLLEVAPSAERHQPNVCMRGDTEATSFPQSDTIRIVQVLLAEQHDLVAKLSPSDSSLESVIPSRLLG
jgi:hypothetical protein